VRDLERTGRRQWVWWRLLHGTDGRGK
jgi:hypothetical protein